MTRPSVPLRQCRGHHDDGWRDDPGEMERERVGDYVGEGAELYNSSLCNGGGVTQTHTYTHTHTNRCWFEEV